MYKNEEINNSDLNIKPKSFDESTTKQLQNDDYNFKYPEKTVVLKHLGSWYKVNFDGAYIVSFLMDYKLFEDPRYGAPTVGFPDSSIDRVVDLLRRNKINYMLKYDDDKLVDYGIDNNFDKFLHNDLPFSYVTSQGEIKKQPKGSFKVQYEGDEPEKYIIGENINPEAELVKKVENGNVGEIIKVNDFNVLIIEKSISY